MATEKRLIDANGKFTLNAGDITGHIMCVENGYATVFDRWAKLICKFDLLDAPTVDKIKLHHVIIDNEGAPEVRLQIGDRYFLLRTDPVDVREVVHGRWDEIPNKYMSVSSKNGSCSGHATSCSVCHEVNPNLFKTNYCPNCGAKMDGDGNGS